MKKIKILALGGIAAVVIVVALVVAKTHGFRAGRVMSQRQAQRRVEQLKEKLRGPADEATREKIDSLIKDFAHYHEFVEVNGEKRRLSTVAGLELRKIGETAIPQLIDAAASEKNPVRFRRHALATVYAVSRDVNSKLLEECLPVFVRFAYDKNPEMREVGVVTNWANGCSGTS